MKRTSESKKLKLDKPVVQGIEFKKKNEHGDFEMMIENTIDTLFLYNENWIEYLQKVGPVTGSSCIRNRNKHHLQKPKSQGIVTGWTNLTKGFHRLDVYCKAAIDVCFEDIQRLISLHSYRYVFFSCKPGDTTRIGTGAFQLSSDVQDYINFRLHSIGDFHVSKRSIESEEITQHAITLNAYAHRETTAELQMMDLCNIVEQLRQGAISTDEFLTLFDNMNCTTRGSDEDRDEDSDEDSEDSDDEDSEDSDESGGDGAEESDIKY